MVSALASRRHPARLMLIGTYRPADILAREHPLREVKQELQLHRQCRELALDFLSKTAVQQYLTQRFGGDTVNQLPLAALGLAIHRRTDGNPLFMVAMLDHLVRQGALRQTEGTWALETRIDEVSAEIPDDLRQLIEKQLDRLSPEEQKVLEVASVAGVEFSAAAVAAGALAEVGTVEEHCARLSRRRQFLQARGIAEWPDATVASRYGFLHALYQEVLYNRLPAARRIELHRHIAQREEQAYAPHPGEIAAELAMHFERGREYPRAVQYLQQAGKNALGRGAHVEATELLTRGLELLKLLPDTPDRTQQELGLQMALSVPLLMTKGYAAPEVEKTYARAQAMRAGGGDTSTLFCAARAVGILFGAGGVAHSAATRAAALDSGPGPSGLGASARGPPGVGSDLIVVGRVGFRPGARRTGDRALQS
jgi:predicted ATPase